MKCPECSNRLQDWFDGRAAGEPPVLCPACAEWDAAARRLDRGLALLKAPAPPPTLADRVVAQVAAERRYRRYRMLFAVGTAAAAAAVLAVVVWQGLSGVRTPVAPPGPPPVAVAPKPDPIVPTSATLQDSVAEASSAVASLTTRTADETVENTRILLPVVDPSLARLDLPPALDPPTRSLREAGEGVSAGLEPVADSARRAVGLFLRELPPVEAPKSGL